MEPKPVIYQFLDVRVDLNSFKVWKGDSAVHLEPKAFEVLVFLIENRGRLLGKQELLDAVWKEAFVTENAMTRVIAHLRKALGDDSKEAKYIETAPTRGYRFIAEVEVEQGPSAEAVPPKGEGHPTPSIAVLPFVNISADAENEYFCDGLAEELLTALSKIRSLHVAARTSAFSFKGKETDIGEIGRKLNVATVLEGSVRKAGDRLRITVQLVNVADGYHLWSERYDRELRDVFDIQDEISLAVVAALKVRLMGAEKGAMLKRYTENTEAYLLYLLGRFHYGRHTEEGFRKALEYYEQAITREPNYGPAFAGLSGCYQWLCFWGYLSPNESLPKARVAAARALAIDSGLAESYWVSAGPKFLHDWDFIGAEREYKRALELDPNNAVAHQVYGVLFDVMGRSAEAVAESARALELDPLSLRINLNVGWMSLYTNQYDRADELARRLIELEPNFFGGNWIIGLGSWKRGRHEEAVPELERAAALGGGAQVLADLGCLYGIVGQREKARQVLDGLLKLSAERYVPGDTLAKVYAGLGEMDLAFEVLERAYEERAPTLVLLKHWTSFVPGLSADPRLADLLRRIGLPH
jgi:serine/threonine-protein kinase